MTQDETVQPEFAMLLNFFKALGHESRLKIIGTLANRECTVGELADMLGVKEPTVSQHLNMLKEARLVTVRPQGNHRYYAFNNQALIDMSKEVFSREGLASLVSSIEDVGDEAERKVLKSFFEGERLTHIPTNERKFQVVLRWLVDRFEYDVQYPEKQVNEIISRHNEDYATLRRALIDNLYMKRENSIYWRIDREAAIQHGAEQP